MTSPDLYDRGIRTAVACWTAYARTIEGAAVHRLPGVDVAVFSRGPERDVLNNAVLAHRLGADARGRAIEAMEDVYGAAGVTSYAAWVHETDEAMLADLSHRGYSHQETTWAMGRLLDGVGTGSEAGAPSVGRGSWEEYLRVLELPPGMLEDADPADFHVVLGRVDGEPLATGMAFDHEDDCGIFNVATREEGRRRGLGSAVVSTMLGEATTRGRRTATLQSTAMARGLYLRQGFLDLGRILELAPPA